MIKHGVIIRDLLYIFKVDDAMCRPFVERVVADPSFLRGERVAGSRPGDYHRNYLLQSSSCTLFDS